MKIISTHKIYRPDVFYLPKEIQNILGLEIGDIIEFVLTDSKEIILQKKKVV
jgi:bifunctional DNA-binding transcriptional regulator/antitoxin component of YhaV-PrlF toxin-antitoxin module